MKNIILVILCPLMLLGCASTTWNINGLDVKKHFVNTTTGKKLAFLAGVAVSVGTHTAGHYWVAKVMDMPMHINGTYEIYERELTANETRWAGRGGALTQVGVGLILELLFDGTAFTDGYHLTSAIEIGTYPLFYPTNKPRPGEFRGDIQVLKAGGANAELEWGIYTGLALLPVFIGESK